MSARRLLLVPLFALAAALAPGCLSPTLPLPPPDIEAIRQLDTGEWLVSGTCTPGAIVTVFNTETLDGAVTEETSDGHFTKAITGAKCDKAWVMEEIGTDLSAQEGFVLQELDGSHPAGGDCR